ncbi:hypothetical protein RHMOL_Rhmol02G0146300 [Rhododendron molle]|uniref:Uncharacterized protein n=1 Tax=Rhododendron molle TaxID=49168 RepID=A0ACC0PPY5_RHOML|nr:hypothetical protein RHMOL_Rhmol02G0146300 [Rhododendron molle]
MNLIGEILYFVSGSGIIYCIWFSVLLSLKYVCAWPWSFSLESFLRKCINIRDDNLSEIVPILQVLFVGEKIGEGFGRIRCEAQHHAAEGSLINLAGEIWSCSRERKLVKELVAEEGKPSIRSQSDHS